MDLGIFHERQVDIYIYMLGYVCLFFDLMIDDDLDDHMLIDVFDFGKHDN